MSLQTLNLNLALTININQDGSATVSVNPDLPTTVKPAETAELVQPAQASVEAPAEVKEARARVKKEKVALAPVEPVIVTEEDKTAVAKTMAKVEKEAEAPAGVHPATPQVSSLPPAPVKTEELSPLELEQVRKLEVAKKVYGNDPNLVPSQQRAPITPPPAQPVVVTPPPAQPAVATPPPAQPAVVTPPPAQPVVVTPPPAQPVVVTPPPAQPAVVTPPPAQPAVVTPPPAQPAVVTPPPAQPAVVTPPPAQPAVVTPPPAQPAVVTPPPAQPVVVTPPPAQPVVVTPPPAQPAVVTPPVQAKYMYKEYAHNRYPLVIWADNLEWEDLDVMTYEGIDEADRMAYRDCLREKIPFPTHPDEDLPVGHRTREAEERALLPQPMQEPKPEPPLPTLPWEVDERDLLETASDAMWQSSMM